MHELKSHLNKAVVFTATSNLRAMGCLLLFPLSSIACLGLLAHIPHGTVY